MPASSQRLVYLRYAGSTLCLVGLLLSLYGYIVGEMLASDSTYSPMCDVNEWISCSKALGSRRVTI